MKAQDDLDRIRGAALDRIDRAERNYLTAFVAAAFMEVAFLIGFLLLADLKDRLHLLLLVSSVGVYGIVAFGLLTLGAHVNRCTERVLKAMEVLTKSGSLQAGDSKAG